MSSALIIKFFGEKSEKFESWEKLENKMKCFFFEKKTFSSSYRPSLRKWEGAKYAGGSRLS